MENGDFGTSLFCGQLSDKPQLAFAVHMVVRDMKRNREGKSNAEPFLTVQRIASQQPALSPGAAGPRLQFPTYKVVLALGLIGLLPTLNLMFRFPEFGILIAQSNQFRLFL